MDFAMGLEHLRIANAAAKAGDARRPVLECVEIAEGKIRAADGFMLIEHPIHYKGARRMVKAALFRKVERHSGSCRAGADDAGFRIELALPQGDAATLILPYENTLPLPDFERCLPTGEPVLDIALGVGVLRKVLDCLRPDGQLLLRFRGPTTAVEFVCNEAHGAFMPIYRSDIEEDGHWHRAKPAGAPAPAKPEPVGVPDGDTDHA